MLLISTKDKSTLVKQLMYETAVRWLEHAHMFNAVLYLYVLRYAYVVPHEHIQNSTTIAQNTANIINDTVFMTHKIIKFSKTRCSHLHCYRKLSRP